MPVPIDEGHDLPTFMTWEELERLPEEIAAQIELWDGRVVWCRRGPGEHQVATFVLTQELRRSVNDDRSAHPDRCWRAVLETNIFFGTTGKSDFVTPDFLVHRCLPAGADVRATDAVLVGEVLSPSNSHAEIEAKKARYASAGISSYWEVDLSADLTGIGAVRVYVLDASHGQLPPGVHPLRRAHYLLVGEWTAGSTEGVSFPYPFTIEFPWSALDF